MIQGQKTVSKGLVIELIILWVLGAQSHWGHSQEIYRIHVEIVLPKYREMQDIPLDSCPC